MARNRQVVRLITMYSKRYGVDPKAALAVAMTEGGLDFGAVGDTGTSFGPFQLHVGGALPRGRGTDWANSPAGLEYAIRTMAGAGARGKTGRAAINAIVRRFERPADPDSQVAKALGYYGDVAPMQGPMQEPGKRPYTRQDTATDPRRAMALSLINAPMWKPFDPMEFAALKQQAVEPVDMGEPPATDSGGPVPARGTVGKGNIIPSSFRKTHETSGLAGYPAVDWFKPAGTVVGAPVTGTITRVSGGKGSRGKGIYGWNVYIRGDNGQEYFLTHFGNIFVKPGQRIGRGQKLGTVAAYGDASHIHVGLKGG